MISHETMERVRYRLTEVLPLTGGQAAFRRLLGILPERVGRALCFLYATAPISDLLDAPAETFLDYARHGAFLYETMPALRDLPEALFLHYILHHRVNTEALAPCRGFFYRQLAERVRGLAGEAAVLAVNDWCAEHAAYQSTDTRTVSPMTVYASARGRCGEESVFAVHALRSVGIPARQVYVPRWSHCDDNHAWVEAYCDGRWRFLGACEPEAALDRGWFVGAASRAMLVHSRIFGADILPDPAGDVIDSMGCATQLSQLERYADAKTLTIHLHAGDGTPAAGAEVELEVINYAGLRPLARLTADERGIIRIRVGRGALHLSARWRDGAARRMVTADEERCTLVLGERTALSGQWISLDMPPPRERCREQAPPASEQEAARRKVQTATAARLAKVEAFCPREQLDELTAGRDDAAVLEELLRQSRGNFGQMRAFLLDPALSAPFSHRVRLLRSLAVKDLSDCPAEVLADHLRHAQEYADRWPRDIYERYLLCPRIATEQLTPWRSALLELLDGESRQAFRGDPRRLWAQLRTGIRPVPGLEYRALTISPAACLRTGIGGPGDRRVLFVAVCRTLGVPARLHPWTGEPEYYSDGHFQCAGEEPPAARLVLRGDGADWQYRRNWSLARIGDRRDRELELGECARPDGAPLTIAAGDYRLLTASRLTDGTVWAKALTFSLAAGECREILLEGRAVAAEDLLLDVPLPAFQLTDGGASIDGAALVRRPMVLLWLRPGEEPTEHILGELLEAREAFRAVALAVVVEGGGAKDPLLLRVLGALPAIRLLGDPGLRTAETVARRLYLDPGAAPLLLAARPAGSGVRAIYGSSGYQVGAADLLLRVMALAEGERDEILSGS